MPRPSRGDNLTGPDAKPKGRGSGSACQPGPLDLNPHRFIWLDPPAWFTWLEPQLAFRFEPVYDGAGLSLAASVYLSDTVRPERRQRGPVYWDTYKKDPNRRRRGTHLGQTKNVTLAPLDQLAWPFLSQIDPVFSQQGCQRGLVRFGPAWAIRISRPRRSIPSHLLTRWPANWRTGSGEAA